MEQTYSIEYQECPSGTVAQIIFGVDGYQPAYYGRHEPPHPEYYEDIWWIEAKSLDPNIPLTDEDIQACKAWVESSEGQETCNDLAISRSGPDPDELRDMWLDQQYYQQHRKDFDIWKDED